MRQFEPSQAKFEKIVADEQQSFFWKHIIRKHFKSPYHYHPECEIIHIRRGYGRRLVGDSIKQFVPGDLVFVAPNVPHMWQVSPDCPEAEGLYIQFLPGFMGAEFFKLPEMRHVGKWLATVSVGMIFSAAIREEMTVRFNKFHTLDKSERLLELMDILCRLSRDPGSRPLGHGMGLPVLSQHEEKRMSEVFAYLNRNLTGVISQAEIARRVRLRPSAFSRFFKSTTGKCFGQVVSELRIAQVCRLLAETDRAVSEIAYSCGFETLSHFNSQFRHIMKVSPSQYRRKLEIIAAEKTGLSPG